MSYIKKYFSVFLAILILLSAFAFSSAAVTGYDQKLADMAENIKACIAFDVTNDKLIFTKNANMKISIASTTKIITSLVALKYVDPEEIFTVGDELMLVQPDSSLCLIRKGHQLKLKTLIAGMLLPSGNDAAYTVAVNVARLHSENAEMTDTEAAAYFCNLMNEYAASLGCKNTKFSNPDGWDDPEHYSTANDMLVFSKEALKNDTLTSIMSTYSRTFWFASGENIVWKSSNALLNPASPYYYAFANGMKTGTTDAAGNCLIASAKKAGVQMLILAFDCDADNIKSDKAMTEEIVTEDAQEITTEEVTTEETATEKITSEENASQESTSDGTDDKNISTQEITSDTEKTESDTQKLTDNDIRFGKVKEMFEFIYNAPTKGDVDISGDISAADARFILRASVGLEEVTAIILERGDIDTNGKLSASDARFILRASVGLEKL